MTVYNRESTVYKYTDRQIPTRRKIRSKGNLSERDDGVAMVATLVVVDYVVC